MINSEPCCGKTLHCGMREMNATNVINGFSVRPGLFLSNDRARRHQLYHSFCRSNRL